MSENNDKELEKWINDKSMGKEKFVLKMTLTFFAFIFFTMVIMFSVVALFCNIFLGSFDYFTKQRVLELIFYIILIIFWGIIMGGRIWNQNKIKFDGLDSVIKEVEDEELKSLILKNKKNMAAKRYRVITGGKLRESLRYVDLMGYYYSITYPKAKK